MNYQFSKIYFLLALCLFIAPNPMLGCTTSEDVKKLFTALEKGTYDVFEYTVDSSVVLGANQYIMHYGSVSNILNGDVESNVEIMWPSNKLPEKGTSFLIVSRKQKYRYKISSYYDSDIFHYSDGMKKESDKSRVVKKYLHYRKQGFTGKVNFKYGIHYNISGHFQNGLPQGVWLYEYYGNREYIQYDEGLVKDTSYHFVITHSGWELYSKILQTDTTEEYWSYKWKDPKYIRGPFYLSNHTFRTTSTSSKVTKTKYYPNGNLKSIKSEIYFNNSDKWRENIRYFHGPFNVYCSNGLDSIRGQYQYGFKVGEWIHSNHRGSTDSIVHHSYSQNYNDSINQRVSYSSYEELRGQYTVKDNQLHGSYKLNDNNKIYSTGYYKMGQKHGVWTTYNDNSEVREIEVYLNGLKHGQQLYFNSDGKVHSSTIYHKGVLQEKQHINTDGQLTDEEIYKDSHLVKINQWNAVGEKITNLSYHKGLPTGIKSLKNGGYATLLNGVYHGPVEVFGNDGKKISYGNFYKGKKSGNWNEWFIDIKDFKEVKYPSRK